MNVLFVCKFNVFRSQVAEAYLKKINKRVNVKSVGVIREVKGFPKVGKIAKTKGLKLKGKSEGLNTKVIKWADVIVIVADNVPKGIFTKKKVLVWKVKDVYPKECNEVKKRMKIIKQIMKKVDRLNEKLEKGKWKQ